MEIQPRGFMSLTPDPASPAKTAATATQFESMMIGQMLQPMFETVEVDPLMGGGQAEQMVRSLLVDEYGKLMTAAGGIGLSDSIRSEILKLQENPT